MIASMTPSMPMIQNMSKPRSASRLTRRSVFTTTGAATSAPDAGSGTPRKRGLSACDSATASGSTLLVDMTGTGGAITGRSSPGKAGAGPLATGISLDTGTSADAGTETGGVIAAGRAISDGAST